MAESLSFRALDRHVIDGRADAPAMIQADGYVSYAKLLHDVASLAGGLSYLGVTSATPLYIKVPQRRVWVLSVLALVRLGAEPDKSAIFRIESDPALVHTPQGDFDFEDVLKSGRLDPAPALATDVGDYSHRLSAKYGDVLAPLLHGGTVA